MDAKMAVESNNEDISATNNAPFQVRMPPTVRLEPIRLDAIEDEAEEKRNRGPPWLTLAFLGGLVLQWAWYKWKQYRGGRDGNDNYDSE